MFVSYFEDEPKYRWNCHPKKDFKYGAQISLWDNDHDIEMTVEDFMFPLFAWLIKTYGYDPKRYETIFDTEADVAFIYFRDNEDRMAFKVAWGENESEWDDENECYVKSGIRVDSVIQI